MMWSDSAFNYSRINTYFGSGSFMGQNGASLVNWCVLAFLPSSFTTWLKGWTYHMLLVPAPKGTLLISFGCFYILGVVRNWGALAKAVVGGKWSCVAA